MWGAVGALPSFRGSIINEKTSLFSVRIYVQGLVIFLWKLLLSSSILQIMNTSLSVKTITKAGRNLSLLSPKATRFIDEYLLDLNQTQAVKRAGYRAKNDNVAHVIAQRLLQKPTVREYLEAEQKLIAERHAIDQNYFVEALREIIEDNNTLDSEKIRALALLAKITGFLGEKVADQRQVVVINQTGREHLQK